MSSPSEPGDFGKTKYVKGFLFMNLILSILKGYIMLIKGFYESTRSVKALGAGKALKYYVSMRKFAENLQREFEDTIRF